MHLLLSNPHDFSTGVLMSQLEKKAVRDEVTYPFTVSKGWSLSC